jgi:hypothetical protein
VLHFASLRLCVRIFFKVLKSNRTGPKDLKTTDLETRVSKLETSPKLVLGSGFSTDHAVLVLLIALLILNRKNRPRLFMKKGDS